MTRFLGNFRENINRENYFVKRKLKYIHLFSSLVAEFWYFYEIVVQSNMEAAEYG